MNCQVTPISLHYCTPPAFFPCPPLMPRDSGVNGWLVRRWTQTSPLSGAGAVSVLRPCLQGFNKHAGMWWLGEWLLDLPTRWQHRATPEVYADRHASSRQRPESQLDDFSENPEPQPACEALFPVGMLCAFQLTGWPSGRRRPL